MGPLEQQGTALAIDMLERARQREALRPAVSAKAPSGGGMSPKTLALLGGLADVAATYAGMRRHVAGEENAALASKGQQRAGKTALHLASDLAQNRAISALVRRLVPRSKPVMDALDANRGAKQLTLASRWGELLTGNRSPRGGFELYVDRFQRGNMEEDRRK